MHDQLQGTKQSERAYQLRRRRRRGRPRTRLLLANETKPGAKMVQPINRPKPLTIGNSFVATILILIIIPLVVHLQLTLDAATPKSFARAAIQVDAIEEEDSSAGVESNRMATFEDYVVESRWRGQRAEAEADKIVSSGATRRFLVSELLARLESEHMLLERRHNGWREQDGQLSGKSSGPASSASSSRWSRTKGEEVVRESDQEKQVAEEHHGNGFSRITKRAKRQMTSHSYMNQLYLASDFNGKYKISERLHRGRQRIYYYYHYFLSLFHESREIGLVCWPKLTVQA